MIEIKRFKTLLFKNREILKSLQRSEGQAADIVELDQTRVGRLTRMDAMQMQAMANASKQRMKQELAMIEAALARISDGTYGYCLVCDEEIAIKRLEYNPAIALCIQCAEQNENKL